MNRRHLLQIAGGSLAVGLAGCAGEDGGGTTPTGTPTDTSTDSPTPTPDGGVGVVETESQQYDVTNPVPEWYEDDLPGRVVVIDSAERAGAALALEDLPEERRAAVEELLSAADYERDRLLYVQSGGPDTCHDRVDVSGLAVVEDRLTGEARAVDTSEADGGCGDALTFPSALVRVRFDGPPPSTVALTITDGFGRTATVTASADDPLAPAVDDLDGSIRPDGREEPIPPLDCDDPAFERLPDGSAFGDFGYGSVSADGEPLLAMRVAETAYERGDRLVVRLTNVSEREAVTGNRHKYALQVHTEAGWEDVRGVTDGQASVGYTDEGVVHAPGEGFEWAITLTPDGVVDGHPLADRLTVCPGLPAGRYRLLYWGITEGSVDAVAVAFDLVE